MCRKDIRLHAWNLINRTRFTSQHFFLEGEGETYMTINEHENACFDNEHDIHTSFEKMNYEKAATTSIRMS